MKYQHNTPGFILVFGYLVPEGHKRDDLIAGTGIAPSTIDGIINDGHPIDEKLSQILGDFTNKEATYWQQVQSFTDSESLNSDGSLRKGYTGIIPIVSSDYP